MHRLWRSAFGLSSARHLTADDALLDDPVPAQTSWATAPRLAISPRLRRTGSYERRGKPNRVVDRSEQRRYLAELAAKEASETAAARAALATLADLGELDPVAFRLFLGLLGDALAAKVPGERTVATTTSDGTMAIRLTALGGQQDDGEQYAEVHTPTGVFRGPDHVVEIVDLTVDAQQERSA